MLTLLIDNSATTIAIIIPIRDKERRDHHLSNEINGTVLRPLHHIDQIGQKTINLPHKLHITYSRLFNK